MTTCATSPSAWMAGRCDPDVYGQLRVYTFSKQEIILGPMMVENEIMKHPIAKQELSWWGDPKSGAEVIRGDLLILPVGNSLLYIEPVFLKSIVGEGIPGLVRVAVVVQDKTSRVAWEPTFEDAISALLGGESRLSAGGDKDKLIGLASQYWQKWLELNSTANFKEAGAEFQSLSEALGTLFSTVKEPPK